MQQIFLQYSDHWVFHLIIETQWWVRVTQRTRAYIHILSIYLSIYLYTYIYEYVYIYICQRYKQIREITSWVTKLEWQWLYRPSNKSQQMSKVVYPQSSGTSLNQRTNQTNFKKRRGRGKQEKRKMQIVWWGNVKSVTKLHLTWWGETPKALQNRSCWRETQLKEQNKHGNGNIFKVSQVIHQRTRE